jgi:hypothetical protein
VLVLSPKLVDPLEHDELDVVVGLLDAELDQRARARLDRSRVLGKRGEGCSSFVLDRVRARVEQFKDGPDPLGFVNALSSGSSGVLTDKVDDGQLEEFVQGRNGVVDREQVLGRSLGRNVAERDKRVPLARRVRFLLIDAGRREGNAGQNSDMGLSSAAGVRERASG